MPRQLAKKPTRVSIFPRLDWRAYWERFKDLHGQPIQRGKLPKAILLFPDGWSHSATNYTDEYPPPSDLGELAVVQRQYWEARLAQVEAELEVTRNYLENLERIQASRPIDIPAIYTFAQEDEGGVRRCRQEKMPLDLTAIRGRVKWLQEDTAECRRQLAELDEIQRSEKEVNHATSKPQNQRPA